MDLSKSIKLSTSRESGVFALTIQLMTKDAAVFPFKILDYDTHSGIDVIAQGIGNVPLQQSRVFYVEFKYVLQNKFNHSFENLLSIVCWDTEVKHDEIVKDIGSNGWKLQIVPAKKDGEYTKYFLNNDDSAHKIEVFVLKDFLREKLKIDFRPRTLSS